MSGLDEQDDELDFRCPDCGGRIFRKTYYSHNNIQLEVSSDGKSILNVFEDGYETDDVEGWECTNCWTTADDEMQDLLNEYESSNM